MSSILVLSLQRLGDVLQHLKWVMDFLEAHPHCKMTFLLHDENRQAIKLIQHERLDFMIFPFQSTRQSFTRFDKNPWLVLWELENLVKELNAKKFDEVFNLTPSHLAYSLTDELKAKHKCSPHLLKVGSQEEKYFNFATKASQYNMQNFEVILRCLNLSAHFSDRKSELALENRHLALQIFTSDIKKNWPLEKWKSLTKNFLQGHPSWSVKIICTAKEKILLKDYFSEDLLEVCTIPEAKELILQSSLVISCDTFVQHLAALFGRASLGVFMGSANRYKTSPFAVGHYSLQSQVSCSPCEPRLTCSQSSFRCQESLTEVDVLLAIENILFNKGLVSQDLRQTQIENGSLKVMPLSRLEEPNKGGEDVSRSASCS